MTDKSNLVKSKVAADILGMTPPGMIDMMQTGDLDIGCVRQGRKKRTPFVYKDKLKNFLGVEELRDKDGNLIG